MLQVILLLIGVANNLGRISFGTLTYYADCQIKTPFVAAIILNCVITTKYKLSGKKSIPTDFLTMSFPTH